MKNFTKIYTMTIVLLITAFACANLFLAALKNDQKGRPYRVEARRIINELQEDDLENLDLSNYTYISQVVRYKKGDSHFFESNGDSLFRQVDNTLYRLDYHYFSELDYKNILITVNSILLAMSLFILIVMLYLYRFILKPFNTLCDIPYELSKGNLTVPVKEQKLRFFGKFIWGIDLLRENMEQQRTREQNLQREKKRLILSISHDIKTPLSAIKLYSKALSKGLYTETGQQVQIAENINTKADEIEEFVSQIIKASNEDFLQLEVMQGEFYLSELVKKITQYYTEKLKLIKTQFIVGKYSNCLLKGDLDRAVETIQNIIENAIKYGDGHHIELVFSEEDDCKLICIKNSGCSLPDTELPHIFESFWRGSNAESSNGSGLGLYICRQLMLKMDGEIFAEIWEDFMCITTVFRKVN